MLAEQQTIFSNGLKNPKLKMEAVTRTTILHPVIIVELL
jgi:hypothetical protein